MNERSRTRKVICPLPGSPQSFLLGEFGRFSWNGECNVTPDDLFGKQCRQGGKLEAAVKLLRRELAFGECSAVEMFIIAEKSGISERTLKRAKFLLGVRSVKRGIVWYWSLPIETEVIYADVVVVDTEEFNRANKGANTFLPACLHG